jgi:hypothetical protein
MKIAFLGWGSLIWDPRNLRIRKDWQEDGPFLPIEFKRYSKDGRMTLVICPGVQDVRTLWAEADFTDIDDAKENLRIRENIPNIQNIGYASRAGCPYRCNAVPEVITHVQSWVDEKKLDAVVWTDIPQNPDKFRQKTSMEMNEDNIITYLRNLEKRNDRIYENAREYVEKTPEQIETMLRRRIRQELHWK